MAYLYIGSQPGRVKITTDTDTLSPELTHFAGIPNNADLTDRLRTLAASLEAAGLDVCIDLDDYFYETPELEYMEGEGA